MNGDPKIISHRLEIIRTENGLTQDEMGEIMGVRGATVSRYISGKVDDIPLSRIKSLASKFGLNPGWILDLSEKQFIYGKE